MKKKMCQKKNANNRSFRKNKPQSDTKEKRYSKAKFRSDNAQKSAVEATEKKAKATKVAETPKRDYSAIPTKFQFEGKPTKIYTATLVTPSVQRYGYSVLSKGQMVRVEEFGKNGWSRVTAQDGRQGIVYSKNNLKALF